MISIAINGYGRIGRSVVRALYESELQDKIKVVAINEPADIRTIAHLTRYDSTHGRFLADIDVRDDSLIINGETPAIFHSDKLDQLPWQSLDIDVVLECSGSFGNHMAQKNILKLALNECCFHNPLSLM